MRPRHWILPIAALVIVGLCAWRATRPSRPAAPVGPRTMRALPPRGWELPDQNFRLTKFDRFLGRHPVVVLFFDGTPPLEDDELLVWLRDHAEAMYDAGWRIVAISSANPAEARAAAQRTGQDWPFPVLTDMHLRDPAPTPVHYLWSRVDRATGAPQPALFLVDRMGLVEYVDGRPMPQPQPRAALESLIGLAPAVR